MPGGPRKPESEHKLEGTWNRAAANGPSAAAKTANHCPPMPADLDDVSPALRPPVHTHFVLLRCSISAAMSDRRHRNVCGAS